MRAQLEREDLLETLAAQFIERKALDLILDSAEYEDVPMNKESGLGTVEQQAVEGQDEGPDRGAARREEDRRRQADAKPKMPDRLVRRAARLTTACNAVGFTFDNGKRDRSDPRNSSCFANRRQPFDPQVQRYRDYARQRQMTLGDLLLENRIVFLGSSPETGGQAAITDYLANITIQKLLFLQYENKNAGNHFYINCPGGSVSATLAIYDTMQFLECPIATYCMGIAASGAAVILAAGTKGKRYALPNSKVMIHQPWGQVGGQVSDIEIQATEIEKERHRLNEILA